MHGDIYCNSKKYLNGLCLIYSSIQSGIQQRKDGRRQKGDEQKDNSSLDALY